MTRKIMDKSVIFNQRVAPVLNRLNQICTEYQIPIFVSLTVGATQNDNDTDFSILASVGGTLEVMPIEQMIGAALVSPEFMNALQAAHARFLLALITMPPEHAQTDQYRGDLRGATAYVAARTLVERANVILKDEADAVRSMSGFFQAMMSEAMARTDHPELFGSEDNGSLPPEYLSFIDSLFKGKPEGEANG